jgi:hypothetical protein
LQTGHPSQTDSALQYPILKFVICFAAHATISNASSGILKKRISSSVSSNPIEVFFIALNPRDLAVIELCRAATCKHHDPMLNLCRGCQNLMRLQGTAIAPRGMPEALSVREIARAQAERKPPQLGQSFQVLLDSGGLYLALGAVFCTIIGVRAVKRLFQGAKRAEPPDPQRRPPNKD